MATSGNILHDNWGFRVKKFREQRRMDQAELSRLSGLTQPHISRIESGQYRVMTPDVEEKLSRAFGITRESLRNIVYSIKESEEQTPDEVLERLKLILPASVPIYNEYPYTAGRGMKIMDYTYEDRSQESKGLEGYVVKTGCMAPEIKEHDIIIVERNGKMINGDIVACVVKDKMYLARLRDIAGQLILENNDGQINFSDCREASPVTRMIRDYKRGG